MATIEQIRAARALIGWSQQDLAGRSGLSQTGIARIENGTNKPTLSTIEKITAAFADEGIIFTAHGVEHYKDNIIFLNSFMKVLEDAEKNLKKGEEILFHCADERRNSAEVTEKFRQLYTKGLKLRFTCCSGNHHITMPSSYYRWIDQDFFADSEVSVIYGQKYALHVVAEADRNVFMVIKNNDFTKVMRKQFEYWWRNGKTWEKENIKLR